MDEKRTGKRLSKIIVILFVSTLLLTSCLDIFGERLLPVSDSESALASESSSFLVKLRNSRIDSMKAVIKKDKDCIYSDGDIDSAVKLVKTRFKEKDKYISLSKIVFNEAKCVAICDELSLDSETVFDPSNIIVLLCDFTVFKDVGNYSKGYCSNEKAILIRNDATESWTFLDQSNGQ